MGQFIGKPAFFLSEFQASQQVLHTFVSGCPPHSKSSSPVLLNCVDAFSVIHRLQTFVEFSSHQNISYI